MLAEDEYYLHHASLKQLQRLRKPKLIELYRLLEDDPDLIAEQEEEDPEHFTKEELVSVLLQAVSCHSHKLGGLPSDILIVSDRPLKRLRLLLQQAQAQSHRHEERQLVTSKALDFVRQLAPPRCHR